MKFSEFFEVQTVFDKVAIWIIFASGIFGLFVSAVKLFGWHLGDPLSSLMIVLACGPVALTIIISLPLIVLQVELSAIPTFLVSTFLVSSAVCTGLGLFGLWKIQQSGKKEKLPSPEECDRELDEVERLHREREKQP